MTFDLFKGRDSAQKKRGVASVDNPFVQKKSYPLFLYIRRMFEQIKLINFYPSDTEL